MVIGFVGRMGSGKTLNMSKYAYLFGQVLDMPIYANYTLENANLFTDFRELENKKDIIVAYDEIHIDFDSREWDKKIRYQFTQWFTQLRKRGIIFMYTTQKINTLEKRIRENTDYIFWCYKDLLNGCLIENLYDTQLGIEQAIFMSKRVIKKPQVFYWLYNTYETISKDYYKKK